MSGLSVWLSCALVATVTSNTGFLRDETVLVPKWTEDGTVMVNKTVTKVAGNDLGRGKREKPTGCPESVFYGLYDFDCTKGTRLMGRWSMKTQCKVYCRSGQMMMPKAKKVVCKKNKKAGGALQWKLKRSWNPVINCVSLNNIAKWSSWSAWSAWSACSAECGTGEKIRKRVRNCINGVMGEHVNCPHQGHISLEYAPCDNKCTSPPTVVMSVTDIEDKHFKVKFGIKNINQNLLSHFHLEVYRDVVEYGQKVYKIADFDMINKGVSEMHVWREVTPLTRYTVWVTAYNKNGKAITEPETKQIFTTDSKFDYDKTQMCTVDWPTTFKDTLVTSCDHLTEVPAGHKCYTYCKDDWRKMRGSEYMTCQAGKWRGSWPKCVSRGWRCDFNAESHCPGCIRPPHCCDHIKNEGEVDFVCNRGYLRPTLHGDRGKARVLMKAINADKASCISFKARRRDCTLTYQFKVIALYTGKGKQPVEKVLADFTEEKWGGNKCRDGEDYDTEVMDVKGMRGYDNVQIVFEAHLDRSQGDLGYDMWFDKFYHGYGRCSAMRCGEFPPPLLKGGGATFGHDVGGKTCTDGDKVGSMCKMNCPQTHPIGHFAHYWEEINCLPAGWWSQPLYSYYTGYCQAPSCNYFDIIPPENGWLSCSHQGYEGSVCTFGCNSIDYKLDNKTPYQIECRKNTNLNTMMWVPTGGPKGFVAGKTNAKCVFNHAFARMQHKISAPLNPLKAMRRQYQELSGDVQASALRKERTKYNVAVVKEQYGQDRSSVINYEEVFHSYFDNSIQDTFESNMETFNMEDHL